VYNPGSTFKAVSTIAALEEKLLTPDDHVRCNGFVTLGNRKYRCMKSHGPVDLHQAIVQSCNVFFYDLGGRPGMLNRLARFATEFGLGAPAGLGLNNEQPGFIPTEEWHKALAAKDPSQGAVIGHALNTVIGEGSTRVTVLQMALLYTAIANGGKLWLPQIVERIEAPSGQVTEEFPPRARRDVSVSPDTLAFLRKALVGVVNERTGTAHKVQSQKYEVAGKTGTAQVQRPSRKKGDDPPSLYELAAHSWFAGFAPAAKPRIAFAVIVEHGGHGADAAAPVAVEIADNYLDLVVPPAEREAPARLTRDGRPAPRRAN
jgi:penicillin-binding protein 2